MGKRALFKKWSEWSHTVISLVCIIIYTYAKTGPHTYMHALYVQLLLPAHSYMIYVCQVAS